MILPGLFSDDDSPVSPRYSPSPSSIEGPISIYDTKFIFKPLGYNDLYYDPDNKIHANETCSIYIARTNSDNPVYFAIKASKLKNQISKEAENFRNIGKHENIIHFISTWVSNGTAFLQMELAEYGSIRPRYLKLPTQEIWKVFAHILSAVSYIHSKSYMHLDISPSNILQCSHPIVGNIYKLADFGTTLPVDNFKEDFEGAGPYVSPETLQYPNTEYPVSSPTDIFSLGVVLLEMVTRKYAPRAFPAYGDLRSGKYDFSKIPKEFSFLSQMLAPNPMDRPTAEQLLKLEGVQRELNLLHPYVDF